MSPRVTLRTIANLAGCSTATVSTVLNGSRGNTKVSDAVRENISAIARRLDYHPNSASRNLRLGRSRILGVYVQPSIWHGLGYCYEMSMFQGLEEAARERGYDLLVLNISCQSLPEVCSQRLNEGRIDGVILLHCTPGKWVEDLLEVSTDVVALDFAGDYANLNNISFDNEAGIRLAYDKLLAIGHTRIGFVGCVLKDYEPDAYQRLNAFRQVVMERNGSIDESLFYDAWHCPVPFSKNEPYCQQGGRKALHFFMAMDNPPTAVICENWLFATAMIQEASAHGIKIPEQLSIVGFDRSDLGEMVDPQLSVVDHQLSKMGKIAVSMLVDQLESNAPDRKPFRLKIPPAFWNGASIAPRKTVP